MHLRFTVVQQFAGSEAMADKDQASEYIDQDLINSCGFQYVHFVLSCRNYYVQLIIVNLVHFHYNDSDHTEVERRGEGTFRNIQIV